MKVIFENDDLIAVDKPSGRPVIKARGVAGMTLQEELHRHAGRKIWVVHRLDLETSGVTVFAKSAEAHRRLNLEFERRRVSKIYWALVKGAPESEGEIEKPIRAFGSGRMGIGAGGKPSITRYRVRERFAGAAWLEAQPLSGRRHQIRVHLCSIGHPILGDARYGAASKEYGLSRGTDRISPVGASGRDRASLPAASGGVSRLMLHAYELRIRPRGQEVLALRAEPPPEFLDALNQLRLDATRRN